MTFKGNNFITICVYFNFEKKLAKNGQFLHLTGPRG